LFSVVYDELKRLAAGYMRKEQAGHTLQPTALVNEVYLKLGLVRPEGWQNREHFLAVAATAMRHVLMDYAKAKRRDKRTVGGERVPLEEDLAYYEEHHIDVLAVGELLDRLQQRDGRMVKLVELHHFLQLSLSETARILKISLRSAEREWALAKAWLRQQLERRNKDES
jgi:RNA polymerase sigma factor (TIGR02999 family)